MKRTLLIILLLAFGLNASAKVIYVSYYPSGEKKTEITRISRTEVRVDHFYVNGSIRETGLLKNGKVHGKWVAYSPSGTELMVAYFYRSKRTGSWHIRDPWKGSSLDVLFQNGNPHYYRSYDPDGRLIDSGYAMK